MQLNQLFRGVVLAAVLFSSCGKKDAPNPEEPNNGGAAFAAKVDGKKFASDDARAAARFVSSTRMLQIIGQNANQTETINFQLLPLPFTGFVVNTVADWKPGTYTFDPRNNTGHSGSGIFTAHNGTQYVNWSTKWGVAPVGEITITQNTGTHIKGKFKFDVVKNTDDSDIKRITEGSFDLPVSLL